jgi:ubiquinone biosynthesis protein UbiJ
MNLFAPLESVLNRNIAASAAARSACRKLNGKALALHLVSTPQNVLLRLQLRCEDEHVSVSTTESLTADATLIGTPLAFFSMVNAPPENAMRSGAIRIEGDAEVAQAFRDLLKAARPDVEEELSRIIGDVGAHQLGNFARGAIKFGQRVANTFAQNVAEYLQEETRDVVGRIELDEFTHEVDRLRDDVERLEARMKSLS